MQFCLLHDDHDDDDGDGDDGDDDDDVLIAHDSSPILSQSLVIHWVHPH